MTTRTHKDGLGQDISIGSKVVWIGGKTQYAGVRIHTISAVTAKMVQISRNPSSPFSKMISLDPKNVVVIDALIEKILTEQPESESFLKHLEGPE